MSRFVGIIYVCVRNREILTVFIAFSCVHRSGHYLRYTFTCRIMYEYYKVRVVILLEKIICACNVTRLVIIYLTIHFNLIKEVLGGNAIQIK
jgi:hypothetical protein